jgi:hypothetical protein
VKQLRLLDTLLVIPGLVPRIHVFVAAMA